MAYGTVSTTNLFCKIFVTNISGRLGSFSRLMTSWQRRGQINHLQITWKMSALTTKKIPKNSGHLSRARVKNGLELPHWKTKWGSYKVITRAKRKYWMNNSNQCSQKKTWITAQIKEIVHILYGCHLLLDVCIIYFIFLWLYNEFFIILYNIIYVWKLNQTVLELDFRAVKFVFFPRRDLNPHHWYTAAPFA